MKTMMAMMTGDHDSMMGGDYGWMMMWMLVWLLIILAVLAVAVFAVVRFSRTRSETHDDADAILRRRFAAGEIDKG